MEFTIENGIFAANEGVVSHTADSQPTVTVAATPRTLPSIRPLDIADSGRIRLGAGFRLNMGKR